MNKFQEVWSLIDTEDKWSRSLALDENGEFVSFMATNAKRFCLMGAFSRIFSLNGYSITAPCEAYDELKKTQYHSLSDLNDRGGYDEVKKFMLSLIHNNP